MYTRLSKFLFPVFFLLVCLLVTLVIRWGGFFLEMDLSLTPVYVSKLEGRPVYLATYADGDPVFMQNQNTLALSALNRGIDHIFLYRRSHIDPSFLKKNSSLLQEKKGAGLWLWKPYFILKTLEIMPQESILIYLDSGYVIAHPIDELVAQMDGKDILLVKDDLDKNASGKLLPQYATLYSMQKLSCPKEAFNLSPAVMAASLVLRNSPFTRKFVAEWLKACEDEALLKGHSPIANDPRFQRSQEDQSLLGVLAAKYKDRIAFLSFHHPIKEKTLAWHHRRKGANPVDKSIIHQLKVASLRGIDRVIYGVIQWAHKIF